MMKTKEIQEWLCLHGIPTRIDDIYGPKTKRALDMFAETRYELFYATGASIILMLDEPLRKVTEIPDTLYQRSVNTISVLVRNIAALHLKAKPREVGGQNMGPWVRYYTRGQEGKPWKWCSGFVCTILDQAYYIRNRKATKNFKTSPFIFTLSCDNLARQAVTNNLLTNPLISPNRQHKVKKGQIFLIPGNAEGDWIHTGIVNKVYKTCFETIEGNATDMINDEADRVCKRIRNITDCHFIRYPRGH